MTNWDNYPLGELPDKEVALLAGVSIEAVRSARRRRGISISPSTNKGQPQKLLFIPDTHSPFHDKAAWEVMVKAAHALQPDTLIHLGDFCDFYAVSTHSRNPERARVLKGEIKVAHKLLDQLDNIPHVTRKIFVEGNHEDRLRRYLWDKAPALFGMVTTQSLLGLESRGWEFVPYGEGIDVGKIYVTHDLRRSGKYSVYHNLDEAGKSVVTGHTHRMGITYRGSAFGSRHVSACFGWLARIDVAADYRHRLQAQRDYQHGFGIGYITADGTVQLQAVPIINNQCVVEGKLIR